MHKIGVLSDTHGLLREEVKEVLRGCEKILHGGDINRERILEQLEEIAPVCAVRGNNDKEWANHIPESRILDIFGLPVFLVHNKKDIPENLPGVRLVIYGHSHKYEDKTKDGVRYLNPGSCGPRRFHQEITLAVLYLEDSGEFRIEKIEIPHEECKSGKKSSEKVLRELPALIPWVIKDIDNGKTVDQIAVKYGIPQETAEQITRMYLTHPGVDTEGILRRMGL